MVRLASLRLDSLSRTVAEATGGPGFFPRLGAAIVPRTAQASSSPA
jgi:hypothetical protein